MIRLYAWSEVPNFGDRLSKVIVEWVSQRPVSLVRAGVRNKLLAVGSVVQLAQPGDVLWGTGIHPDGYESFWKNSSKARLQLTALAVRGPITRDVLLARQIDCPGIYGDPAILLPLLYPKSLTPTHAAILLPHFNDYGYFSSHPDACLGVPVVNPAAPWQQIVDAVTSASLVIASSLHGLIVAEAYGVPAIWFRPNQSEGYLKYQDYYASTQRAPMPVNDLKWCLRKQPPAVPDYTEMRARLMAAFDTRLIESKCSDPVTQEG